MYRPNGKSRDFGTHVFRTSQGEPNNGSFVIRFEILQPRPLGPPREKLPGVEVWEFCHHIIPDCWGRLHKSWMHGQVDRWDWSRSHLGVNWYDLDLTTGSPSNGVPYKGLYGSVCCFFPSFSSCRFCTLDADWFAASWHVLWLSAYFVFIRVTNTKLWNDLHTCTVVLWTKIVVEFLQNGLQR